jgi:ABC-type branched-subunit amino acid transport system substrate-binding protein
VSFLILSIVLTGQTLRAQNPLNPVVKIGVLLLPGSEADLGARLAVKELNATSTRDELGRLFSYEIIYPNRVPNAAEDIPNAIANLTGQGATVILGPESSDLAVPNLEPLARAGVPVLTLATGDTLTDVDVTNNIMRVRASERFYSQAAADYLVNELGLTRIALVQTNIESTEALIAFEIALTDLARPPVVKVQLEDNSQLEANLPTLLEANPDAIAMWGAPADALTVFRGLRSQGWTGVFFYRHAQEAVQRGELIPSQVEGMLGANAWAYAMPTVLSRQFVVNYVTTYGEIPGDSAAAAYDTVYVVAGQARVAGIAMPALYESLLKMPTVFVVQGRFSPQEYGNGDFSRAVNVYRISEFGAPEVLARYENYVRLSDEELALQGGTGVGVIGTPTFTPIPTETPTTTPEPSATPAQVQLTVIGLEVAVMGGPGEFFEEIGRLPQGTVATVIGGDANFEWFVIQYRGGIGWVANDPSLVSIFDPGGLLNQLPVIDAPPTPPGGVTATPLLEVADLIIDSVTMNPPQPVPGQSFIANVVVRNAGTAPSGAFSVGASFEPGAVFSSNVVPNIAPGATVTVPLSAAVVGTGEFMVNVVADISNQVNEGTTDGEGNNIYFLTYRVDYPVIAQASLLPVAAGSLIDLYGGVGDLSWTGTGLNVVNGALIGVLTGVTFEAANYDAISPALVNNNVGLTDAQIFPGVIIGVITAEGQRAVIRIESRAGTSLNISYRVYGI